MNTENDIRLNILNTLLTTPHRKLDEVYPIHTKMILDDPRFYVQLGAWYAETGEVRDHQEMFVVQLCLSKFEGHREVGLAMIREMPPYQVVRVCDFIFGKKIKEYPKVATVAMATRGRRPVRGRPAAPKVAAPKPTIKDWGLNKQLPRSVKTEIQRYLADREADNAWFDSSVLTARKAMKRLYVLSGKVPTERAQAILFDDKPPADSSAAIVKELAKATDPTEQAKIIVDNKVPYRVAATVVTAMSPPVLAAIIEVMTPQELINNIGSLTKRGVMENADLKALVSEKLTQAKKGKRVAALKSLEAVKATPMSADIQKQLEDVADAQMKSKAKITRPTALFVDKSGSMSQAIELGKRIGSLISAVMDAPLYVYAHDTIPYPITCKGTDLAEWEKAFAGIKASGWTSMGCPVQALLAKKQFVENIVLITDEGENTAPYFFDVLDKYKKAMNADPAICIVKTTGATDKLEAAGRAKGITVDAWQFSGGSDYYSLPGLLKFLTRPSKLELLMEIMGFRLPVRRVA
jgi:hypothetical protein